MNLLDALNEHDKHVFADIVKLQPEYTAFLLVLLETSAKNADNQKLNLATSDPQTLAVTYNGLTERANGLREFKAFLQTIQNK